MVVVCWVFFRFYGVLCFSFLLAFLGLCCVAVSAAFVFAEGASVACPADLDASVLKFNYFDRSDDDGFPYWLIIFALIVVAWNRNWNKQTFSIRFSHALFNLLKV